MNPYGCHSQPRKDGYWGWDLVFQYATPPEPVRVLIPDVMSKECNYRKTTPDPRCQGCTCP